MCSKPPWLMGVKPSWLIGSQEPRLASPVVGDTKRGQMAVDFCRAVGMTLYPWQEDLLFDMCRTGEDELWQYRETVVSLARQNGKGEVLVARELVGIYLFGEMSILHTAHFLDTAMDARDRLWEVIESNDELMNWWAEEHPGEVPQKIVANGKDGIKFPHGATIRYRTRTKKTGRGLSIQLLILDECFDLPTEVYAALNSVTKAQPNAQKIYISSPVNRFEHMHGAVFSAKRWAGIDGAKGTLFREWSPDPAVDPLSREAWIQSNPSMVTEPRPGVQLSEVEADAEAASKSRDLKEKFLVETLGIGNWYLRDDDDSDFTPIIGYEDWEKKRRQIPAEVVESCVGIDVAPNSENMSLVAALQLPGDDVFLSLAPHEEFERDVVVDTVVKMVGNNDPLAVIFDPKGTASTLQRPLEDEGLEPELMRWTEVTKATELFMQLFREGRIVHDGDERWTAALQVAQFRAGNENGRALTKVAGDVTPLVAAIFAVWGLQKYAVPTEKPNVKTNKRYVGKARRVTDTTTPKTVHRVAANAAAMAF